MPLLNPETQDHSKGTPSLRINMESIFCTYEDVLWVGDGSDDSGSNHELFPSLGDVDNVNSLIVTFVHVWSHQAGAVLSTEVNLKLCKIIIELTSAVSIRARSCSLVLE